MSENIRMSELGKRAVACKGWRWMPGMHDSETGLRLDEMTDDWEGEVPDLTDPATLGCLLALVREAYLHSFGSEAEALVAALEAAE